MVPDSWKIRRRWMKIWTIVLSINAQVILFYMLWDGGKNIAAQVAFAAILGVICVISFLYVFGAVYDPKIHGESDHHEKPHAAPETSSDDEEDVRPEKAPAEDR